VGRGGQAAGPGPRTPAPATRSDPATPAPSRPWWRCPPGLGRAVGARRLTVRRSSATAVNNWQAQRHGHLLWQRPTRLCHIRCQGPDRHI